MNENVFYVDAKSKIVDFLAAEFDDGFSVKLQNRFLNFFPLISNYQEEGKKFHPKILFTDAIDTIVKHLPSPIKIEMFRDDNENMFDSRVRALIPFCERYWCVYIEAGENYITYGLLKNVCSIKDRSLEDVIFGDIDLRDKINDKVSAFMIYAYTRWTVTMRALNGRTLNTNFALDIMGHSDLDNEVAALVNASFSQLKTTAKKLGDLKNMFHNMFKNVLKDIGGTLCVVVDKDFEQDGFLSDGIWLKEPISISKLFLQTTNYSEQKLISIANLFYAMLDKDGITVVDNQGQIRAFNVFVKTDHKETGNIIGGARKRAAYTVINSRRRDVIGVYFQSYDGEIFFAPVKR